MNAPPAELEAIRRILVALDGSGHSLAALDIAAALAAQLHAELEALFVEDADLLSLADLPCARVTSALLLETERTDRARMERQLRLQAARARANLQRHAGSLGIQATFRTVRGKVTAEVLAAAAEADLISLGKAGYDAPGWVRPGSTLRAALEAGRPLLVVESQARLGQGLLVSYDGSNAAMRALLLARDLAVRTDQRLNVLILTEEPMSAEFLSARVRERLADGNVQAHLHHSFEESAEAVVMAARRLRPALLLLGLSASDEAGLERAKRFLKVVDCPLLLVP